MFFAAISNKLEALSTWNKEEIKAVIAAVASQFELKLGKVAQPLRIALTGNTMSPSIDVTIELIGKKRVIAKDTGCSRECGF